MNKLEPGITISATVVKVKDGDTVRVKVEREFDVRLIHPNTDKQEFNTPELATNEGKRIQVLLAEVLEGQKVMVFIPANKEHELLDFNSFNRVLGSVWHERLGYITQYLINLGLGKLLKRGTY